VASRPPTKKQLAYLRRLVRAQGQSFTKPKSMQEASEQIDRLTKSMSAEARAWGSQMSNAERELARNKARL
jgi:Zn-dependent M16 (insulinase) family peptidase